MELEQVGYRPDPPRVRRRAAVSLDDLSVQQVASRALDRCAAGASTWTRHTVQEHVTRVITETGVRATPEALRDMVAITTALAVEDCLSVLPPDVVQPDHVAHLTSLNVVAVETHLRDKLQARATAGASRVPEVTLLAQRRGLDAEQAQAAAAVASADPLVVVEGAAGAGKTTMLGAAIEAAADQGRLTRIVTPTKKAADVAAQELGVSTDSVAKLVHEHGWRWNQDGEWTRLAPGDPTLRAAAPHRPDRSRTADPRGADRGGRGRDARPGHRPRPADRCGRARRDPLPDRRPGAAPRRRPGRAAGHGGAALAAHLRHDHGASLRRSRVADLTVQMRRGEQPALLFDRLHALGLVVLHESTEAMQEAIARDARDGDAITVATNDETRELNERIRDERVRAGVVDDARTTSGSDGLSIGRGDVIQTRQNDADVQVANRQTWTVQAVAEDGTVWATENSNGRKRQRTVRLPAEYVTEHTHLAYASTAYGAQGATVPGSHTILSDTLDASGVYVGMTRGQETNQLHIVAADPDDAREQFTAALERDRADRGLVAATQAAREAVTGLVPDGPVALVNAERTRLAERIERAEAQAGKWERAVAALTHQAAQQQAERERQEQIVAAADAHAAEVRADVAAPLIE